MFSIMSHRWGQCQLCNKEDRDTLHVKCLQNTMNTQLCLKCLVSMVKMRQGAEKREEAVPLFNGQ